MEQMLTILSRQAQVLWKGTNEEHAARAYQANPDATFLRCGAWGWEPSCPYFSLERSAAELSGLWWKAYGIASNHGAARDTAGAYADDILRLSAIEAENKAADPDHYAAWTAANAAVKES